MGDIPLSFLAFYPKALNKMLLAGLLAYSLCIVFPSHLWRDSD